MNGANQSETIDWLRPELDVLETRFRNWKRELAALQLGDGRSPLSEQVGPIQHIADRLGMELRRYRIDHSPATEPEDLRRLLSHAQRLTEEYTVRRAGLDEVQQLTSGLVTACERLLHESTADIASFRRLLESLIENARDDVRPWVLHESTAEDDRSAMAPIVRVGVPATRLAARVARRLGFARRETVAVLYASLLQDCGYLLAPRRGTAGERNHPQLGAALAAGLLSVPTESLAAIAGHHAEISDRPARNRTSTRRVDCLVSVVTGYIETSLLREQTIALESLDAWERSARGLQGEVIAALKTEMARTLVPRASSAGDTDPAAAVRIVPAPRFLRSHGQTPADGAVALAKLRDSR